MYSVKEIYHTIQCEGENSGRSAVFCRFSGCNLWSGREADREGAVCSFCDTDFLGTDGPGGGQFEDPDRLAGSIVNAWPALRGYANSLVVCTGGEPLLQLDSPLVSAIRDTGFDLAVETNGTVEVPAGLDWVCVSPKAGSRLVVLEGDELKLVYPQSGVTPEEFLSLRFDHFFLQPMDGPHLKENTRLAVEYCQTHPEWRLSLQMHKFIGLS